MICQCFVVESLITSKHGVCLVSAENFTSPFPSNQTKGDDVKRKNVLITVVANKNKEQDTSFHALPNYLLPHTVFTLEKTAVSNLCLPYHKYAP